MAVACVRDGAVVGVWLRLVLEKSLFNDLSIHEFCNEWPRVGFERVGEDKVVGIEGWEWIMCERRRRRWGGQRRL